jgi:DNA-binding transcriptional MerR regulator
MGERRYTIRQLTKELRVTARTLRYYEDEGMVKPARSGLTRIFSEHDRARLIIILRGRRLGFSVTEMKYVAQMYDYKDGDTAQMVMARRKFEARIRQLEEQKLDLEQALRQLRHCVAEINDGLEGKPRTPWPKFFEQESALPALALAH